MCGRFVAASDPQRIAEYFGAEPPEAELPASYNVAPTSDVYAVVEGADGVRRVEVFHWGLVPVWAKDVKVGYRMINARAEKLKSSSAFKPLLRKHRCIVPMDGFFEWQAPTGPGGQVTAKGRPVKQPMFVHRLDGEPLAVAGLWTSWRDPAAGPDAPWLHSLTVVTTDANSTLAPVHDRMPALLARSDWKAWLDPSNQDIESLRRLLGPAPDDLLGFHPVSTEVNRATSSGAHLIEPVDPDPAGRDTLL